MYCRNCGTALADNAAVCSKCGVTVTPPASQQPYQNPYYNHYAQQPDQQQEDRPSAGFNALVFFFPIVGLILFLVWKDQRPRCARSIGKWALIGFIAEAILAIVSVVLAIALFMVAGPSDFGYYDDFAYGLAMKISTCLC